MRLGGRLGSGGSDWRGRPLTSLATIVSLIGSTKTHQGLRVRSQIDPRSYAKGVGVTAEQMAKIRLEPHAFHGDWNYTIRPAKARSY